MKKYLLAYKLSWERELEYRFNFFLGRLRNIIVLLMLYFVWLNLSSRTGRFAGYTQEEILTYVFGVNIIRSLIFGSQSRDIAMEINQGIFSKYLLAPVNYFWFNFFRQLAQRIIYFMAGFIESALFIIILDAKLFIQTDWSLLFLFVISVLLATFLYYILTYLVSLLSFWSRESMGPRFLFDWFLEFASGSLFPLDILSKSIFGLLTYLPFLYLIYLPMSIYLGRYSIWQILTGISMQVFWIVLFGVVTNFVWKRGLRHYSGEGI